jgi:serine/threonine protein kinase
VHRGYTINTLAGRLVMGELFARGPVGEVWTATLEEDGGERAVKFMPAVRIDENRRVLFWTLHGPHLSTIYEHGYCTILGNDYYYIVNPRSRTHLSEEFWASCDQRQKLALLGDIYAGLAVIHNYGIVHRNVKPTNVLVNGVAEVSLSGFDLIKELDGVTGPNSRRPEGHLFAAPEMFDGRTGERADIWAATAIFLTFELGSPLFGTAEPRELEKVVRAYRRIESVGDSWQRRWEAGLARRGVDGRAIKALLRGLNPAPRERPAAQELRLQVDQILGLPSNRSPHVEP